MKQRTKKIMRRVGASFLIAFLVFGSNALYWAIRPNRAQINDNLNIHTYPLVSDGRHNSNTDMIYWNNSFYMIHASAPYHMGSPNTELRLLRSSTAEEGTWEFVKSFSSIDEDIRDPKFAAIGSRLFIYVLRNSGFMAEPYGTAYCYSEDGNIWTDIKDIKDLDGWLFWRPKTNGSDTWYCPAYWHEHGKSVLLNTSDGINWEIVSQIHEGDGNDETAIEFLPDDRIIATLRLEIKADNGIGSNEAGTMIAVSQFPYTDWSYEMDKIARLDGPRLFSTNSRVFAIARFQPEIDGFLTQNGGILSRKRTSIYEVTESEIRYVSDLTSAGDTSYAGVVLNNSNIYTCYYTSSTKNDYPWIIGMLAESDIIFANFSVTDLMDAASDPLLVRVALPWITYIVTAVSLGGGILLSVYMEKNREIEFD